MSISARGYIISTAILGFAIIGHAILQWESQDLARFFSYFFIAILASTLKVILPGITGSMSVNFLFILIGILDLSFPETIVIGCTATMVQCVWKALTRPKPVQLVFSVSGMAIAIAASYFVYHSRLAQLPGINLPVRLGLAACTYFLTNTIQVAVVISMVEKKSVKKVWQECYFWSFPYYLLGAAIAGLLSALNRSLGWQTSLLILPVIYFIYRSYCLYLGRLEGEKMHAQEMADLHLRTIEALALAIDAKDATTHDHLRRVQVYALEIGKELGMSERELEALRAAALLHDIGKLAVPEHIISKPGRLTPEEFEKMKIHPVVGAEILERVQFPYPVVPIVRSHHEKWNGNGYPHGLKGEEIPLGARILAAVDCLDALSADRQYRRALPLEQAMEQVAREAGADFDPRVVEILQRRYVELEHMAKANPIELAKLSTDVKIERGQAPATGFENTGKSVHTGMGADSVDFLSSIAAAHQEVQILFELTQDLGNSLSLDETLSVLAVRLKKMISYDSIAIYLLRENKLLPEYVNGEDSRLFSSLEIPLGQGLSGWVAENQKPIINGNPSVESGYLNNPSKCSTLQSGLAVPLEGLNGVVGVLSLYRGDRDAFMRDHLRILQAVSPKLAQSIENALKYRQVERSATTDALTGLPNARSLFLHLNSELARCKRQSVALAVLVCDLNGFKQVNDRFGHLEGDKVLRLIARDFRATCRPYDYAARMGGDEFVLILPGVKPEELEVIVQRLCHLVVVTGLEVCGEKLLSLSVGEAYYSERSATAEHLLAEADRRMYKVKHRHYLSRESAMDFSTFNCEKATIQ
jgi:diguanylate cyclase (GGDEF)-like protein/putative nucleotidyltransferase with HDIG domain